MPRSAVALVAGLLCIALSPNNSAGESGALGMQGDVGTKDASATLREGLPMAFVQDAPNGIFWVRARGFGLSFGREGITFALGKEAPIVLRFVGVNGQAQMVGEGQSGPATVIRPNGTRKLPSYRELLLRDLWPGIDLRFQGRGHRLKYDLVIRPGADVSQARLQWLGIHRLLMRPDGSLEIGAPFGSVTDSPPRAFQLTGSGESSVPVRYQVDGTTVGFRLGNAHPGTPVVIDPEIDFSTFLGGSMSDEAFGVAIGGRHAFVTGSTASVDFPMTPGAFDPTYNGSDDVFVAKLTADGSAIEYATYLGGSSSDIAEEIALDDSGHAYVTGETSSADFPSTPNAFDSTHNGGQDAFVTKLSPAGDSLVYSTFIGGNSDEQGRSIAVTGGRAYITGVTSSPNFPATPGSFDVTHNGGPDAFATQISASGSKLGYSTFLGGSASDVGRAVDLRGAYAFVVGFTDSANFPTTPGSFDLTVNGSDAFALRLNAEGSVLDWSTFLGGSSSDEADGVAVDGKGNTVVVGTTSSADLPTTPGAFDQTLGGNRDAFVTKVHASGSALVWSTYLGGNSLDEGGDVDIEASGESAFGESHLTGETRSNDFPITPGGDPTLGGSRDAFYTILDETGSVLRFSTFHGGNGPDVGRAVEVRGNDAYLAGWTSSVDFPAVSGFDEIFGPPRDAFLTKFRR